MIFNNDPDAWSKDTFYQWPKYLEMPQKDRVIEIYKILLCGLQMKYQAWIFDTIIADYSDKGRNKSTGISITSLS